MRRVSFAYVVSAGALLLALSGCNCGTPPVDRELSVTFIRPVDGQQLTANDELDPATPGMQIDVEVEVKDQDGNPIQLESVILETRLTSEAEFHPGPEAVVDGTRVLFPRATLQPNANELRVSVKESGTTLAKSQTITVTVGSDSQPVQLGCPAEGQILRESDDANPGTDGYQVKFCVDAPGLVGASATLVCEKVCGLPPRDFTIGADAKATLEVTLTDSSCEERAAECYVMVRNAQGATFTSERRGFSLDTRGPDIAVTSPLAPSPSKTFPVEAVVGCAEEGQTVTLTRADATGDSMTGTVTSGAVFFPNVTVPADGTYQFTLSVTDQGGNARSQQFSVVVASTPATLVVTPPASPVSQDANGDPSDGVQGSVAVAVNSEPVGTKVELWTSVAGQLAPTGREAFTVQSGANRVATFEVDLAEGANSLKACVRNPAGLETCQLSTVTVSTGRPACKILSPTDNLQVGASGDPVALTIESGNGSVTVNALDDAGQVAATASGSAVGGTASVSLDLPADGAYRLVAACPAGGVSQAVAYRLDTAPPELNSAAVTVRGDTSGAGQLGPSMSDTSTRPGMQVIVDVQTEAGANVSVTGCEIMGAVSAKADGSGVASLREVSVPASGACELTVSSTDAAGNASTAKKPLSLGFNAGTVQILDPVPGRQLGPADGTPRAGGGLTVPVTIGFTAATSPGMLKLFRGSVEVASVPVAVGDTNKVFPNVDLDEGANALRAELVTPAGTSCASGLVLVRTTEDAIAITLPVSGAKLNLFVDQKADEPGIQTALNYAPAPPTGGTVDICASVMPSASAARCRDGSGFWTLAVDVPPSNPQFSFPDGRYQIKAVLDVGGSLEVSDPVDLTVDGTRPSVLSVKFQGDANADGHLNLTEQGSGTPMAIVTTSGLEDGQQVAVKNPAQTTTYGAAAVAGDTATVPLAGLTDLTEANYELVVVITDAAGNKNKLDSPAPLDPVNSAAFSSLRVDRVAPGASITSPLETSLSLSDDADGNNANGFQLRVSANTSADVPQGGLTMLLTPPGGAPVAPTITGGAATHDFTVATTGATSYAIQVTATDASGNVGPAANLSVVVDAVPPGLTLNTPNAGAGTYTSNSIPVNVTVAADPAGDTKMVVVSTKLTTSSSEVQIGTLNVVSGVASGTLSFPNGTQTVYVRATDDAGNSGEDSETIIVAGLGCSVLITQPSTDPAYLNRNDDRDTGTADLQYRLEGSSSNCPNTAVTLKKGSGGTVIGTTTTDATGNFTFDITLPEGPELLTVEMTDGFTPTSDKVDVVVDLTPPGLSGITPIESTLYFVASTNVNLLPPSPVPGYVADKASGGNAEADISFTVTGAQGGTARVLYRGSELVSLSVDADPKSFGPLPVSLTHNTSGTFEIRVKDAAGNEVVHSASATVDVLAPAAPTTTRTLVAGQERAAKVDVTWNTTYDDGSDAGSGAHLGYDLRWTTNAVSASGIPDEATFFGSKTQQATGGLIPWSSNSTNSLTLDVPPLASYSIVVRAKDEIGNYSPLVVEPALNNFLTKTVFTNEGSNTSFGFRVVSNGSLNGDALADLVVTSSGGSAPGTVWVYYGNSNLNAANKQRIDPPDSDFTAQAFGWDASVGQVGDEASENKPDLVISAPTWSSNQGRAFLLFGTTASTLSTSGYVQFRGVAGSQFGRSVQILPDMNGDSLGEIFIAAPIENSGRGRVYIFYGRPKGNTTTAGTWMKLQADNGGFIPASAADRIIDGPTPVVSGGGGNQFGREVRGFAYLGDLDNDSHGDFTVPDSKENVNKLFLFSGQAVKNKAGNITTGDSPTANDALQTLSMATTSGSTRLGFGTSVVGNVNLIGNAAKELLVGHPITTTTAVSYVHLYADGSAAGYATSPTRSIKGTNNFGNGVVVGDLNGDSRPDIVVGENVTTNASVWILYNSGASGTEFDLEAGTGFRQSKLQGTSSLGVGLAIGDFNGDNKLDLAAGDDLDSQGKVTVWH